MRNVLSIFTGAPNRIFLTRGGSNLDAYSILGLEPPLVLDFDENYFRTGGTATDLVSAATHTRASSATYVDANGILQTAAINGPRVGHHIWNGSAWVDEGYFHESEARTNLITQSTGVFLGNSSFVTLTTGQTNSLSNYSDATLANDGSASGYHRVTEQSVAVVGGITYTVSCFAKDIDRQYVGLAVHAGATTYAGSIFNLANGTVAETKVSVWSLASASAQDFGNGWYHCSLSFTVTDSATAYPIIMMSDGSAIGNYGTSPYVGSSKTLYIYGVQFEAASTPSSYIPTAGATVTRAADALAEVTPPWGSALSVNVKGTETFADDGSATQKLIYDRRVDANNRITLALDTAGANTGKLTLTMVSGGSSATISTTAELTPNINEPFNVAFVCTATELGIALNGTAETRVTHAVGLPDLSAEVAAFAGMGTRSLIREWADDLTDAGIEKASA